MRTLRNHCRAEFSAPHQNFQIIFRISFGKKLTITAPQQRTGQLLSYQRYMNVTLNGFIPARTQT